MPAKEIKKGPGPSKKLYATPAKTTLARYYQNFREAPLRINPVAT
jgi:hypothetical protein